MSGKQLLLSQKGSRLVREGIKVGEPTDKLFIKRNMTMCANGFQYIPRESSGTLTTKTYGYGP